MTTAKAAPLDHACRLSVESVETSGIRGETLWNAGTGCLASSQIGETRVAEDGEWTRESGAVTRATEVQEKMTSVDGFLKALLDSCYAVVAVRAERYQAIVREMPSSNATVGSYPSNAFALRISACESRTSPLRPGGASR